MRLKALKAKGVNEGRARRAGGAQWGWDLKPDSWKSGAKAHASNYCKKAPMKWPCCRFRPTNRQRNAFTPKHTQADAKLDVLPGPRRLWGRAVLEGLPGCCAWCEGHTGGGRETEGKGTQELAQILIILRFL